MSIDALLKAAEYLDRREKEAEHGYASPNLPPSLEIRSNDKLHHESRKRLTTKARKPQGCRSTHNELEKNRRAHLRDCLQCLKDIVPVGSDNTRHTTLGLLNKAKHFIRSLEDKDRKSASHKETLLREQRYLKRRVESLSTQVNAIHKRRSVSECSSTSTVSQSSNSESDEHEVDVIGYGGTSDDDHSSIRSGGSDGGVGISTWRHLTLGEETL